jgi:hypothetical protein
MEILQHERLYSWRRISMGKAKIAITLFLLALPVTGSAAVIHVPGDQPTIQAGIDAAADGDTVLVASGIYTGPGNKNLDFMGKAITVKSEHGAEFCVINCEIEGRGCHFHSGEGADSILEGFTIRNGYVTDRGGGIYCEGSSPTIRHNILTQNIVDGYDSRGGGMACYNEASPLIEYNTISQNRANWGGGIYCRYDCAPTISHNVIRDNIIEKAGAGGIEITSCDNNLVIFNNIITGNVESGIECYSSSPIIINNIISNHDNSAYYGGGIRCRYQTAWIENNMICDNAADAAGGGIYLGDCNATIRHNVISGNTAYDGGGIYCIGSYHCSILIENNLITENSAFDHGGGIGCAFSASVTVAFCTLSENSAARGAGISFMARGGTSFITNSILWGNTPHEIHLHSADPPTVTFSDVGNGYAGEGNIDENPRFVSGPSGRYYLSHTATGQAVNSPCVNTGNPAGDPMDGTTRTDLVRDTGIPDMGYHYPRGLDFTGLITGAGPGYANPPLVRIFPPEQNAVHRYGFNAYGTRHYGVNTACGNVDGGDFDEILTGPGPGPVLSPHVRGFTVSGGPLPGLSFLAYGTRKFGVNIASGDLDRDGVDELISGAGPGAVFGPHIRAFSYDRDLNWIVPVPGVSFMAYTTRKWGANVAGADIDGDGYDEILTGAGPGPTFATHVRGWNVDGGPASNIPPVNFFAFGTARSGVFISGGDVDGDGYEEIITAPGPSRLNGAHIRGWDYDGHAVIPLAGCDFQAWPLIFARYGARVFCGADLDGDSVHDIIVGRGPDPYTRPMVRVFHYHDAQTTAGILLQAYPAAWNYGVTVAAGRF